MRPIDADRLLKTIADLDVECADQKQASIMLNTIQKAFPVIVNDEPTIEVVTKERYHETALKVLHDIANETGLMERYDDAERALRVCVNSGILGRIEHELFGGDGE